MLQTNSGVIDRNPGQIVAPSQRQKDLHRFFCITDTSTRRPTSINRAIADMITNLKAALFVVGTFVQNRTLCRTYGLIMYSLYHYGMAQRKASALGSPSDLPPVFDPVMS